MAAMGNGRLAGKTALITGAAGGIGQATARLFLAEGAKLALLDRDEAVKKLGGGATLALKVDITDETAVREAVARVEKKFGGLDVLVNNAAARAHARLAEATPQSWAQVLGVNVIAAGICVKAALPLLRASGNGAIVNVSSAFALIGRRGMGQYDASKAALVSMTRTLAAEEASAGVRVNAVCPGSVATPYTVARAAARGMTKKELLAKGAVPSLMNRWATPEEIAFPILWLASDEASFVTGAALAVDGGLTASLA